MGRIGDSRPGELSDEVQAAALSVRGARKENQDAVLCRPELGLFAVSDGMGGHEGGATASRLAVAAVDEHFARFREDPDATWPFATTRDLPTDESLVDAAFREAHRTVRRQQQGPLSEMGATLALVYLSESRAVVGHIGDSRVYHLSEGTLTQLTRDHSLYETMKRQGAPDLPPIEQFELAHVVTRAIGAPEDDGRPELVRVSCKPGDTFLLCTDGLSGSLSHETLASGLLSDLGPEGACATLVDAAIRAGSRDNVSAVIVRTGSPEPME